MATINDYLSNASQTVMQGARTGLAALAVAGYAALSQPAHAQELKTNVVTPSAVLSYAYHIVSNFRPIIDKTHFKDELPIFRVVKYDTNSDGYWELMLIFGKGMSISVEGKDVARRLTSFPTEVLVNNNDGEMNTNNGDHYLVYGENGYEFANFVPEEKA